MLLLALLVLGPKRLHTTLAQIARAKAQFENATHNFKSQIAAEFDQPPRKGKTDRPHELARDLTISSESRDE